MYEFIAYLLKSLLSGILLLLYYWFVLRNTSLYYFNRLYLMSVTIFMLLAPMLHLSWFSLGERFFLSENKLLPTLVFRRVTQAGQNFTPGKSWLMGYFVISAALILTLLIRVIGIYKLKDRFPKTPGDGFTLFETSLDAAPFSFLKNVFWKKGISLNDSDGKRILRHELAHIAGKHTYDKLFMQLIVCVFWINPLYWIIQKELNLVHEFIADSESIEKEDTAALARILLLSYDGYRYFDPSHSFFQSPVKRRLSMMAGAGRVVFPFARKIMALPLLMLVFAYMAFTGGKKEEAFVPNTAANIHELARDGMTDKRLAEEILQGTPDAIYVLNRIVSSREAIRRLDPADVKNIRILNAGGAMPQNGMVDKKTVIEITTR